MYLCLIWTTFIFVPTVTQNDVVSLEIKIGDSFTDGMQYCFSCSTRSVYFTLWYNLTIYQYEIVEPDGSGTYTANKGSQLTVIGDSHCSTFQAKLMINNPNEDNVCIDYVKFTISSGDWYQIDTFKDSDGNEQQTVCVDDYWLDGPPQQIVYFDVSHPNICITKAEWDDGTNVSTELNTCGPTINPMVQTNNPTPVPSSTQLTSKPTFNATSNPTFSSTLNSSSNPSSNRTSKPISKQTFNTASNPMPNPTPTTHPIIITVTHINITLVINGNVSTDDALLSINISMVIVVVIVVVIVIICCLTFVIFMKLVYSSKKFWHRNKVEEMEQKVQAQKLSDNKAEPVMNMQQTTLRTSGESNDMRNMIEFNMQKRAQNVIKERNIRWSEGMQKENNKIKEDTDGEAIPKIVYIMDV